jgi:hypothetical protein
MIEKRKALTATQNEAEKIYPEEQLPDQPAQNYLTSPAYINGVAAMATLCRSASTC